ncbi:ArsS family sensor histidine kinase [Arcobacter sp. 15-2]|uniref:ArsS family sensor histidine kinase n=1 Tax=Arcobacter sp. 15-2 TaxID=3374109 RepID=UPI00399D46F3
MFNKHSIFFNLAISLFITILLLFVSFFTIIEIDNKNNFNSLKRKYMTITKIINQEYSRFGFTNDLRRMIDEMDLDLIDKDKKIKKLLETKELKLIMRKRMENILLHIFKTKEYNILHFQTPFEEFIIIDKETKIDMSRNLTLFIFLFLLIAILFIAYTIYKKLSPLSELQEKIDFIGDTNMCLDFLKETAKDEVSLLAKALLDKSKNINQLKNARDVFIRNIMHELKTPITKGRFLVELENNQQNKAKLQTVFHQLESLISEFAVIEEVIAKKDSIEKKDIFFDDIIENVLDMMMIEDENKIEINQNNCKYHLNFKLFSIVVKNLIDNALKYSFDNKVKISVIEDKLIFQNTGKPLQYNLEKYYEPFFSNTSNDKESFGLGLYIIKSILDAHNFKLQYNYQNNTNTFTIVL